MVPISMYVCAARPTTLALLATSSMLLPGAWLQGSGLDQDQDLENGPCAGTSFCRLYHLEMFGNTLLSPPLVANFCRVQGATVGT